VFEHFSNCHHGYSPSEITSNPTRAAGACYLDG
jgi:hypothetical protein